MWKCVSGKIFQSYWRIEDNYLAKHQQKETFI